MAQILELITISEPEQDLNIENCQQGSFTFKVTFANTSQTQYRPSAPYEVWISRSSGCSAENDDPSSLSRTSCGGVDAGCCEPLVEDGQVSFSDNAVYSEVTLGPFEMGDYFHCDLQEEGSFEISVYAQPGLQYETLSYQWIDSDDWHKKSLSISFDLLRPDPPVIEEVEAGETSMELSWIPLANESTSYRAYAASSVFDVDLSIADQESSLTDLHRSRQTEAGASSALVSDLRRFTTYYVTVVSIDDLDNESFPAPARTIDTVEVQDFYELYRQEAGGGDAGGYCGVAASSTRRPGRGARWPLPGVLLMLGLLVLGRRLQRRRRQAPHRKRGLDHRFVHRGMLSVGWGDGEVGRWGERGSRDVGTSMGTGGACAKAGSARHEVDAEPPIPPSPHPPIMSRNPAWLLDGRNDDRRRQRAFGGLLALLLLLLLGASRPARAESPRSTTFALSFGSSVPAIDDEFHSSAGPGPYERFFGDEGIFFTRIDLGWHLSHRVGTLSFDLGAALGSISERGFVSGSSTRSVEDSSMRLLPLSLSLTYAFDLLAERLSFPFVPFGSVGLDYVFWWIYDGEGDVAQSDDPKGKGKGGTYGFHGSFGLRLLLDVLSPDMAQSFDLDMGVNNSFLFVEYLITSISNFGDPDALNLSSGSVFFGIAFEF